MQISDLELHDPGAETRDVVHTWAVLIVAGLVAGVSGTVTGVGSVFSYPALLGIGLPPTAANVTNTVALAVGGVGGAYGSRPELAGQAWAVRWLCLAGGLGSGLGSVLLLAGPPGVFERVVPFLVAAASLSILLPRPTAPAPAPGAGPRPLRRRAVLAMLVVSIYNGYFAAAGGVLIMAVLLATTTMTVARVNGLKNVLVLVADMIAALAFAVFGPVSWTVVPPLAVGLFAGSWIGPAIARRLPAGVLRVGIALIGLGLAVALGLDAY